MSRDAGIDGLKLLAALAVIAVHVGDYRPLHDDVGDYIRLLSRWAVPFFFIISGYYMGSRTGAVLVEYCASKVCRLFVMLFAASLFLLPLAFVKMGLCGLISYWCSPELLMRGGYFHLWFLSSMLTAYVVVLVMARLRCERLLCLLAVPTLFAYLVLGAYNPISQDGLELAQYIAGVGFLLVGRWLSRVKGVGLRLSVILVLVGLVVSILEASFVEKYIGNPTFDIRLLVGTLPLTVGLFYLARSVKLPITMSNLGRDCAMLIYVAHPYWIYAAGIAMPWFYSGMYFKPLLVMLAFFMSLVFALFVNKYARAFVKFLSGDPSLLRALEAKLPKYF